MLSEISVHIVHCVESLITRRGSRIHLQEIHWIIKNEPASALLAVYHRCLFKMVIVEITHRAGSPPDGWKNLWFPVHPTSTAIDVRRKGRQLAPWNVNCENIDGGGGWSATIPFRLRTVESINCLSNVFNHATETLWRNKGK